MKKIKKKETVWIVVGKHGAYVDYRNTRKDMKQHHCDTLGYINFDEAVAKGDKCIKATLTYTFTETKFKHGDVVTLGTIMAISKSDKPKTKGQPIYYVTKTPELYKKGIYNGVWKLASQLTML